MSHLIGSMYPGHSEKPSLVGMLRSLHPARWTGCLDWSFVISSGKTLRIFVFSHKIRWLQDHHFLLTLCHFCMVEHIAKPMQDAFLPGRPCPEDRQHWGAMIFDSHLGGKKSWYLPSDATGWIMVMKVDSSWWFTFSKRTLIRKGLLVGGIVE